MNNVRSTANRLFENTVIRALLVVAVSFVLFATLIGASFSKYSVLISDDTTQTITFTSESDPQKILAEENIVLAPYDTYTFSGFENNTAQLTINRAHAVKISADSAEKVVFVTGGTVQSAIDQAGITVDDDDLINVPLTETVTADTNVTINRVEYRTVVETEEIPFETISYETCSLSDGKTRSITEGVPGAAVYTYDQTLIDGKTVDSVLAEEVRTEPQTAEQWLGSSDAEPTMLLPDEEVELDENGNPVNYSAKYTGKATAYSALGKRTKLVPGCVAMDLTKVPRGSSLYIKTPSGSYVYGYSEVRDTGTAAVDGIILVDLFFNSYAESCAFGAKTVEVYVLD